MNPRSPFRAVAVILLMLALAAAVGAGAYQAGFAHGLGDAGHSVALPTDTATRIYVWPGPWHGGFFPFGPLFGLLIAFVLVRALLWGGAWRGRCGYGRYRDDAVPPAFEEWHRRAHERQDRTAAPSDSSPRP
jgi:hypothetical protein